MENAGLREAKLTGFRLGTEHGGLIREYQMELRFYVRAQAPYLQYDTLYALHALFYLPLDSPIATLYSIFFLHALFPSLSISGTSTGPLTSSSSSASTTASPTRSALSGLMPPAPINHVNLPPTALLTILATPPAAAMGNVNVRDESYMNGARMNIDRMLGNVVLIIDSASRFVVM
jgi:hypothetical protein